MSLVSVQDSFSFWEFVSCGRCHLAFSSISGPTLPFWLTECGHVVCNSHLNADQSCSQCGAHNVQVVPLQTEMDAPMSDWFRSVPAILDAAAYAARFQQEAMASQIRFLRSRCQQQRGLIERLRRENVELKKQNEVQLAGGHHTQERYQRMSYPHEAYDRQMPSDMTNSNGKRPMRDPDSYPIDDHQQKPLTTSSPRSNDGQLAHDRLTIPAARRVPDLLSGAQDSTSYSSGHHQKPLNNNIERYAYVPPSTASARRTGVPPSADSRRETQQGANSDHKASYAYATAGNQMRPPPTPLRFKSSRSMVQSNQALGKQSHLGTHLSTGLEFPTASRFGASTYSSAPPTTSSGNRTVQATPMRGSRRFMPAGTRAMSRGSPMQPPDQRTPFIPGRTF